MKNVTFANQLKQIINNKRIAVIGLGNTSRADDGFGIKVAEPLKLEFTDRVFIESEGMDEIVKIINGMQEIDFVVFVDTIDAHEKCGTILISEKENIEDIKSSHKIPLKLYLSLIEKPCCLIGIQPKQLDFMKPISKEVEQGIQKTVELLTIFLQNR